MDLSLRCHHDGSSRFISNTSPKLGETITVRLLVEDASLVDRVFLRSVYDGEPRVVEATAEKIGSQVWWSAELPVRNPRTHYRWLLHGGDVGYAWLTAAGLIGHDLPDANDFAIAAYEMPPDWLRSSVVYQIFPDRFASSGAMRDVPAWAVPRPWGQHPEGRSPNTGVEYFGGDLDGITAHLDHLQELGVNVVYMTPFFPANSTHRYDATTFDHVDPLLGGDEALKRLIDAAHSRGMKVMGDITLNHCGRNHEWFLAAQAGDAQYRDYFTFDSSLPHGYECWLGVASLPKFNFRNQELLERLITSKDSVIRRWLRFGLDGWRVDVANMAGRQGDADFTHELARLTRQAVAAEGADKALIAEHFHDAGADLDGSGWHGGMNYAAFMNPVWTWLRGDGFEGTWHGIPIPIPRKSGGEAVKALRSFASRMPWRSYEFSWPLLGSHDTARVRTVTGSAAGQKVAATLLMTLPGTPMIFAGDEIGAQGKWGEDSRTCFPWESRDSWDEQTLSTYRELISLRRSASALTDGGLRWVHIADDLLIYLRESESQRILVAVSRSAAQSEIELANVTTLEPLFGDSVTLKSNSLSISFTEPGAFVCALH